MPDLPTCFLFDNGSLRAASTLNLRRVAAALVERTGAKVEAVSLLHSSGVAAEELGGERARLLEPALESFWRNDPEGEVVVVPFFFGPSGALTEYLPERIGSLQRKFPRARVKVAKWLVVPEEKDTRVAEALAGAVREVIASRGLTGARVVLTDHGSPQRGVTDVRAHLVGQLRGVLGAGVREVGEAAMERRPGPEYAFNDPLLAERLRTAPFDEGDVVVALQFLSPGRHAGAEGDVAQICDGARRERSGLRTYVTETIGGDPRVVDVLAQRYREALDGRG